MTPLVPSSPTATSAQASRPAPAYTPGPAQSKAEVPPQSTSSSTDSDPYAFLRSFEIVFLIDDSGSMAGRSWRESSKALGTITPICIQQDADGIDLYFLNHPDSSLYMNITTTGTVVPPKCTPLSSLLRNGAKVSMYVGFVSFVALMGPAHALPTPDIDRGDERNWNERAMGAITETFVSCASLPGPIVYLLITGGAAYHFRSNRRKGKAAVGMLATTVVLSSTAPSPGPLDDNDGSMRAAVYLSFWFFMISYCRVVMLRNG